MNKGFLSNLLRNLRLIWYTDQFRYLLQKIRNQKENKAFRSENPQVALPPDYLIYESFQIHYSKYYKGGRDAAVYLAETFGNYMELKNLKILDWGCGPGRIIRHLPEIIGNGCQFFGTDYNQKSIEWCSNNLPGIRFNNNTLEARLPYPDHFFDIIYGISIFTHLSARMHAEWHRELIRILKPGGILYLTTQGNNFKCKLTELELKTYNQGQLVVRGKVKEGHRTYSAFQPKQFMEALFSDQTILDHTEPKPVSNKWIPQDIWIVRK
jgi:SAM-dependent methyltransferase